MNGNPNKKQKDWHQWQIEKGSCVTHGMLSGLNSLHHIQGSKAKLKEVPKFGEWYTLCLDYWWHQDGHNKAARHVNKKQFELECGTEKELYLEDCELYKEEFGVYPMSDKEYQIILERA